MVNKDIIIDKATNITRLSRKDVEEVINVFLDQIIDTLAMGEKVNLTGFGSFEVKDRKGRKGVDPRSLQPIQISTVRVAKFKAGKTLKESVK